MNRVFFTGLFAFTLMFCGQSALAATTTITFSGTTLDILDDFGGSFGTPLAGQPAGFFSFDDSLLSGVGFEEIESTDFTDGAFLFGSLAFNFSQLMMFIDQGALRFQDGSLLELDYANSSIDGAYDVSLFYDVTNPAEFNTFTIGNNFTFDYAGGELTASASVVPLPAAAWLFGSALLGLGALKRKKT